MLNTFSGVAICGGYFKDWRRRIVKLSATPHPKLVSIHIYSNGGGDGGTDTGTIFS